MKIYQAELPFNEAGINSKKQAKISWHGSYGVWFYVQHQHRTGECLYADEKGNFYYAEKELSRVVPVVWNIRKEANRVARKHKGRVKKYPYRLESF